jgi:hypothetical protein
MDVFEKYLTFPGKTDPPLSIFEHSLYVLQVANYLIRTERQRGTKSSARSCWRALP